MHPRVRESRVAHCRKRFFCEQVMRIFVDGGIDHFVIGFKIFIVQNNFMRIGFVQTVDAAAFFSRLNDRKV